MFFTLAAKGIRSLLIMLLMLQPYCCVKLQLKQSKHYSRLATVLKGNTLVDLHVLGLQPQIVFTSYYC